MKVGEIMARNVKTVHHKTPIRALWKVIMDERVNSVPVVDEKEMLVGIISKQDMLEALYPDYRDVTEDFFSIADFEDIEKRITEMGDKPVRDIMRSRVIFTREDTPIMRALSRMLVRRLNQMPVLSYEDTIIGLITKGDIFKALVRHHLLRKGRNRPEPSSRKALKRRH
ncbi:CBS domain-containing protein [Patescibacteria group bacterium]|nr:CBS domain-containing protein [Patescibacteria group bacterium]